MVRKILRIYCLEHPGYLADLYPVSECDSCKKLYLLKTRYGKSHGIGLQKVNSAIRTKK